MGIDTLNIRTPFSKDKNRVYPSSFNFDLKSLIDTLKHSNTWAKGELNSLILLNSPDKQIILTALHENTEVKSFQSKDSITLQIIEGKLKFNTRNDSVILYEGQFFMLHENKKFSLTSMAETVFLLTILNKTVKM